MVIVEEVNQSMQIDSIVEFVEIDEVTEMAVMVYPISESVGTWQAQGDKLVDLIEATREYE